MTRTIHGVKVTGPWYEPAINRSTYTVVANGESLRGAIIRKKTCSSVRGPAILVVWTVPGIPGEFYRLKDAVRAVVNSQQNRS